MLNFSIREACKALVSRERYQQGWAEKTGKRRKRWKLHWYIYVQKEDGSGERRKHRAQSIDATKYSKADAYKKLAEIIARETKGTIRPDDAITVERFYRTIFLPTRTWSGHTSRNNEFTWKNHVAPFFGEMRLCDVRRHHVDRFFQTKHGLGASTLVQIRNAVNTVFGYAVENEYINRLRIPKLHLKKVAKKSEDTKVLTINEARRVASMGGEHGLVYRVLLYGGLRIGELLALRWSDVGEATLRVDESVESGSTIKSTKSGETRDVPLPQDLRSELLARRGAAADDHFIFGGRADAAKWVSRQAGGLRWLKAAKAESGIADLDFHSVRRTTATLLRQEGALTEDVQAILGHADKATTNRHYIKPVAEAQQRAVAALVRALGTTKDQ